MFGEGIGSNDGWTIDEEKLLIELMTRYNGNMAIVAETLGLHPDVISGGRRRRSIKQCVDRWFNTIIKEYKNNPAAPISTVVDVDMWRRNLSCIATSALKVSKSFHTFDLKSIQEAEMHRSHARATQEARAKQTTRIETEKKLPFLCPLRDDFRSLSTRGSTGTLKPNSSTGRSSRQSGTSSSMHSQLARPGVRAQAGSSSTPGIAGRTPSRVSQETAKNTIARAGSQVPQKNTPGHRLHNSTTGPMVTQGTSIRVGDATAANRAGTTFNIGSTANVLASRRTAGPRSQVANGNTQFASQPTTIRPNPLTLPASVKVTTNALGPHRRFAAPSARKPQQTPKAAEPSAAGTGIKKPVASVGIVTATIEQQIANNQPANAAAAKITNLTIVRPLPKQTSSECLSVHGTRRTEDPRAVSIFNLQKQRVVQNGISTTAPR
eukprot:IDg15022t1